jgi:hypothetical protein
LPDGWYAAGGVNGTLDLSTTITQGSECGQSIGAARGVAVRSALLETVEADSHGVAVPQWRPQRGSPAAMWVDSQNDVKASDIELALLERGHARMAGFSRRTPP